MTRLFAQVMRELPTLNVLVNNAGILREINLHDQSIDLVGLTSEIEVNLNGPIRMIHRFLSHLKALPSAAIVNVSKAARRSYTRSLRVPLKHTSVRVFELAPPVTRTPILSRMAPELIFKRLSKPAERMLADAGL
jgi:uncharacterized oxidoreductase